MEEGGEGEGGIFGILEGVEGGIEVGEEERERGEIWVVGEDGIGLGVKL